MSFACDSRDARASERARTSCDQITATDERTVLSTCEPRDARVSSGAGGGRRPAVDPLRHQCVAAAPEGRVKIHVISADPSVCSLFPPSRRGPRSQWTDDRRYERLGCSRLERCREGAARLVRKLLCHFGQQRTCVQRLPTCKAHGSWSPELGQWIANGPMGPQQGFRVPAELCLALACVPSVEHPWPCSCIG